MSDYNDLRNVRVGLEIFERHAGGNIAAEHDVIYAGQANGEPLSEAEAKALLDAGWVINSECCAGCAEEGQPFFRAEGQEAHALTCNEWMFFT